MLDITNNINALMIPLTLEVAPDCTFKDVLANAAVAGIPPNTITLLYGIIL